MAWTIASVALAARVPSARGDGRAGAEPSGPGVSAGSVRGHPTAVALVAELVRHRQPEAGLATAKSWLIGHPKLVVCLDRRRERAVVACPCEGRKQTSPSRRR